MIGLQCTDLPMNSDQIAPIYPSLCFKTTLSLFLTFLLCMTRINLLVLLFNVRWFNIDERATANWTCYDVLVGRWIKMKTRSLSQSYLWEAPSSTATLLRSQSHWKAPRFASSENLKMKWRCESRNVDYWWFCMQVRKWSVSHYTKQSGHCEG